MSENRFIIVKSIENYYALVDKERDDIGEIILLSLHKEEQLDDVCDLLNELNDENKTLKAQLYWEGGVCNICKHQQLTPDKVMQGYYTAKCEKGHKDCSKEDLKHCKDFKLKGDD